MEVSKRVMDGWDDRLNNECVRRVEGLNFHRFFYHFYFFNFFSFSKNSQKNILLKQETKR